MIQPRARARHKPGVMNKTEAAYSAHLAGRCLAGEITEARFEPMRLRLGGDWKTTYTPDFQVILPSGLIEFHEVKGFMRDDAAVKLKVAAAQFPEYRFVLVKRAGRAWESKEVS